MNLIIKRIVAFYIDAFISAILALIIYSLYNNFKIDFNDLNQNKIIGGIQAVILIVCCLITEYKFNTTVGKKIMGLKVIFLATENNKLRDIFIRNFSRLIPFDCLSFVLNSKGNLWHDLLSETKVISFK